MKEKTQGLQYKSKFISYRNSLELLKYKKEEKELINQNLENEKNMLIRKTSILKTNESLKDKLSYNKNNQESYHKKVVGINPEISKVNNSSKIISREVKATRNIIEEISSDIYSDKLDEMSDCTSLISTGSRASLELKISQMNESNPKKLYQDFVKLALKIKFEKLHNSHKGHEIPEKVLFRECSRQSIPRLNWFDFIYNELQNTKKYEKFLRSKKKIANRVYS